jgi:glycosyltransferase involved in cell wall biosynthesis
MDYLTIYLSFLCFLLFRTRRTDLVVVKTDPPLLSILGWFGRTFRSYKLVSWCQDVFPEVAEHSLGTSILTRPLYGLLKLLRNASLRRSDRVVVLSGDMEAYLKGEGVDATFATIPNWAIQTPGAASRSGEAFREGWGLAGRFVLGYSGNLGRAHETATLLDALPRLQQIDGLTLLFIGGGAGYEQLKAATADYPEAFIRFLPYQSRENLSETLKVPHIHWFSLVPEMVPFVFPSKFYGILESGRPVVFVGDPSSELSRTIEHSGCGFVVAPGDVDGFVSAVEKLHADARLREQLGVATRELAENDCSRTRRLADWVNLVENLLKEPS